MRIVARLASASVLLCTVALSVGGAAPALASPQRSSNVAIILGEGSGSAGTLQTSGTVTGSPQDSFEQFTFTDLLPEAIEPSVLSQYDTVVLNQVFTSSLSEAQKQALSSFVTSGGKLIVHDADGTEGNEYQWLPVPALSGQSCLNCGNTNGEATVVENNALVSSEPSSPSYVDVSEFPGNSDAVGDANFLLTTDPRWFQDIRGKNDQNIEGAIDAYATDGGLIIYNGFDTDFMGTIFPSGNDWLAKLWYSELAAPWDPDNLPHSQPIVGSGGHCGFHSITIGVVSVCAETISVAGSEATATGSVVLDNGVSVGNGPISINEATKQISVANPTPIGLLRKAGTLSLGSAAFSIDASGTTDPISGAHNLAQVSLTGASLGALGTLRVGNLPFSLPTTGSLSLYLDGEQGGGLVGAATIQLPMVGKLETSGSLSLGFFAGSPQPATVVGGSANFGSVDLGGGWKFEGFTLSYQQPTDTWTASGGLAAPIGSLHASGSVIGGALDSLQVEIGGQDVPLGDSGFFFTNFGGGFSGLAKGPLTIDATTAGFWGVPKAPFEPFYLDNVTVTVSFAGSVSLDGAVSLAIKDGSPLHGALHLKLGLHPFQASGSASIEGSLPGVSMKARGGAGFTSKHFTASEGGTLGMYGLSGTGEVIVSDKGLGASGTVCAPHHFFCQSLALAGTWTQIGRLDVPAIIGGEPRKLITVSGVAAAGHSSTVSVPGGRRLLLVTVRGSAGAPAVLLRAPNGRVYARSSRTVLFSKQPQFGLTTIAVLAPRPGRWRISNAPGELEALHVAAQTLGSLRLIRAAPISPGSSARHPLNPHAGVRLRWNSANLPAGVRITIVRRSQPHEVGVGVAGNLPAAGQYVIPVSKLAPGRNYLTLAASIRGVPFEEVNFAGQAWRKQPPPKVKHKRKHG
jgi:hypothetical protein